MHFLSKTNKPVSKAIGGEKKKEEINLLDKVLVLRNYESAEA